MCVFFLRPNCTSGSGMRCWKSWLLDLQVRQTARKRPPCTIRCTKLLTITTYSDRVSDIFANNWSYLREGALQKSSKFSRYEIQHSQFTQTKLF